MARARKLIEAEVQVAPFAERLSGWILAALRSGKPVDITAITTDEHDYDQDKSDVQREKFHAMIGDIKKTAVIVIPGRRIVMNAFDAEQCKALLVVWFANEMAGTDIKIPNPPRHFACPITGENITIRPSTTKWGKKLTAVFVEWLYATGTLAGTRWSEPAIKEYENYREAQQ